ncbi:copper uptake system-associated protein [Hyphomicrobium sp. CS1GBMeth3]|uniref:copper uptake system-associated protein n=1 Tax=Hyphomicrobium sp. CS1GBMeth3 TaxID=1892845 RepID=UPI00093094C5|nr:copper uptake system-associated protein [Hyphomicrobium sp. CS1GBMeth3]
MALSCAIHSPPPALAANDADQIRALIGATWDKPDSKVETDPVVISGDHAVASWTQGSHGGRALLRRGKAGWSVVLCSGDPLREANWLAEAGVPGQDAEKIAQDLKAAEAKVSVERRAMFSLFEGVISGDGPEHQAPAGERHHPHH